MKYLGLWKAIFVAVFLSIAKGIYFVITMYALAEGWPNYSLL
jgi:hypothetical protein